MCSESRISTEQGLTSGEVHAAASTAGAGIWEAAYGMSTPGALIQWALSPYLTYPDQIRELQPDVVLTQVCFFFWEKDTWRRLLVPHVGTTRCNLCIIFPIFFVLSGETSEVDLRLG